MSKGQPEEDPGTGLSSLASGYRKAKPYLDAAWLMTGSVAFGTLGGYFLDRWLGTKPWILVAGSGVGMIAGFIGFVRAILALDSKGQRKG